MRKAFLVLIVIAFCWEVIIAQSKSQRRIYLWDVTLSMKGGDFVDGKRTANIYDDVVEALCRYIDGINNENTEILVLPFQEKILPAIGPRKASLDGKEYIKQQIKSFILPKHKWTNIYAPIAEVMDKYLDAEKNTAVFLLTDGFQDDPNETRSSWEAIEKWNLQAGENNFLFYVYLTAAAKTPEIEKAIRDAKNKATTPINVDDTDGNSGDIDFLTLTPPANISFNLKDNREKTIKSVPITFISDNSNVPQGMEIKVKLADENPFFSVDQTVLLKNNSITFELKFKNEYSDYEVISKMLSETTSYKLIFSIADRNKIVEQQKIAVSINPGTTILELINKPEKSLRIHVKRNK